jgi:transposase InsO family protein
LDKEQEKWAIFWCDLLSPLIYGEIDEKATNRFLKDLAEKPVLFPDGRIRKPSLSTLRRKLNRYRQRGFDGLQRQKRSDRGRARNVANEVIEKAIALKKEQPYRSPTAINGFLHEMYATTVPRATLYRHLKAAGATRIKLGITRKKVRKRWSREHTHDLWVGDFEQGPYVAEQNDVVPTHLSAFIDCHSRYIVEARYYFRQNLDILIDSLIRAWANHGAPLELYLDNAKVYHAIGLKAACYRLNIKLLHRPPRDPAPGGLIERFFQTAQVQFEAEVRVGELMGLAELNRAFSAWLAVSYHKEVHSQTGQPPQTRYEQGLTVIRQVDMDRVMESFMQSIPRTVNRTFSDVQVSKRYYRVDPKLRGDRVQVRFDPFSTWDKVQIHSLDGQYLGTGLLHNRETGIPGAADQRRGKPEHSYTALLIRRHKQDLAEKTGAIDYRNVVKPRPWPFHEFANTVAHLMGLTAGLAALCTGDLEALKKVYNQSRCIDRHLVKKAFEKALQPSVPYIIAELKQLIKKGDL